MSVHPLFYPVCWLSISLFWYSAVASLWTLPIRGRVIGAIAFQKVDDSPHRKARAKRHDKGLQGCDRTRKKSHKCCYLPLFLFWGRSPANRKSRPYRRLHLWTKCPQVIQKRPGRPDRNNRECPRPRPYLRPARPLHTPCTPRRGSASCGDLSASMRQRRFSCPPRRCA